jgi:glycosyltransferase 2 family protein
LLWLALRDVPFVQVLEAISHLNAWQIALLALANALILGLGSLRWWWILRALQIRLPFIDLLGYRLAGFGVSYLTPGPQFGGEPLQVYLLRRRHGVGSSTALASVYFDKLIELFANFVFLITGVVVAAQIGMLRGVPAVWLVGFVPLLAFLPAGHLLALRFGKRPLSHAAGWMSARVKSPLLARIWHETLQAETKLAEFVRGNPRTLLAVLAVSALVWVVEVAEFYAMLIFLGGQSGLAQSMGILTAARIAFLMPLPAGLGALEGGLLLASTAAGLPPALGIAASLVIRARDTLLALAGVWIGGWKSR